MKTTPWSVLAAALTLTFAGSTPVLDARAGTSDAPTPFAVSGASVAVRCPLTVGGSFEAKTNALRGELGVDPERQGEVEGTLAVDLRTLETGIGLRDAHMLKQYLEVERGEAFAAAILKRIRLSSIDLAKPAGKGAFLGVLALHGQEREVAGTTQLRRSDQKLYVRATFPMKLSDFGIPTPTYLGMGVQNEVTVTVSFQTIAKQL
jgi:polyisoprenoid-binding protein YceI